MLEVLVSATILGIFGTVALVAFGQIQKNQAISRNYVTANIILRAAADEMLAISWTPTAQRPEALTITDGFETFIPYTTTVRNENSIKKFLFSVYRDASPANGTSSAPTIDAQLYRRVQPHATADPATGSSTLVDIALRIEYTYRGVVYSQELAVSRAIDS